MPPIKSKSGTVVGKLITEDIDHVGQQQLEQDEDPKGFLGPNFPMQELTAYEKKEERMLSQRVPEIVWLRVYHVTAVNKR